MSSRRAASPAAGRNGSSAIRTGSSASPAAAKGDISGKLGKPAASRTGVAAPALAAGACRRANSANSSPQTSSERLQLRGSAYTQKPKPSALRGLRHDSNGPSPQASPAGSSNGGDTKPKRSAGGARSAGGEEETADAPAQAELRVDVPASGDAGDEDAFVPEEDVQGSQTQGDHLMFRKARMPRQSPVGSQGSPGLEALLFGGCGGPKS